MKRPRDLDEPGILDRVVDGREMLGQVVGAGPGVERGSTRSTGIPEA